MVISISVGVAEDYKQFIGLLGSIIIKNNWFTSYENTYMNYL